MKNCIKFILVILLAQSAKSMAQSITTYSILNTAYDRINHIYYTVNDIDPDWKYINDQSISWSFGSSHISSLGTSTPINPAVPTYVIPNSGNNTYPGMVADRSINSSSSAQSSGSRIVTYRTYFTLPDLSLTNSRFSLHFKMSADDAVYEVKLNGNSKAKYFDGNNNDIGGGKPYILTIPFCDPDFTSNLNYIDVSVADAGAVIGFYAEIELLEKTLPCDNTLISGVIFNDNNSDGIFNTGDVKKQGETVYLKSSGGVIIASTVSNNNGYYQFTNQPAANYVIDLQNIFYVYTVPVSGYYNVDLSVNPIENNKDFGITYGIGEVRGKIFIDDNINNLDPSDIGMNGITVYLKDYSGNIVQTTTTLGNGDYVFQNVLYGYYLITEQTPFGYFYTFPSNGVRTCLVNSNLVLNMNIGNISFENAPISISGYINDPSLCNSSFYEPIPGVTVQLKNSAGTVMQVTQTDIYGFYSFNSVPPTVYYVEIIPLPGYSLGSQNPVMVSPNNQSQTFNVDFTLYNGTGTHNIAGRIFNDVNGNSIFDGQDAPLPYWDVTLTSSFSAPLVVQTDQNGFYNFGNVPYGMYVFSIVSQVNYQPYAPFSLFVSPCGPDYTFDFPFTYIPPPCCTEFFDVLPFIGACTNSPVIFPEMNCRANGTTNTVITNLQTNDNVIPTTPQIFMSAGLYQYSTVYSGANCATVVKNFQVTVFDECICDHVIISIPPGPFCYNNTITMSALECNYPDAIFTWSFGDGTTATGKVVSHVYLLPLQYNIQLTVSQPNATQNGVPDIIVNSTIVISDCIETDCKDCIGSFAPSAGEYIISLWVKEALTTGAQLPRSYSNAKAEISFTGVTAGTLPITISADGSKNKIIDGWQRIEQPFTIPTTASNLKLKLVNTGTLDAYYDDIRIFPTDGQMKTYVYDPITLRLTATLDENNYATFYEYDEEGKLIRVKKETEKGVMTIQESREGTKKK